MVLPSLFQVLVGRIYHTVNDDLYIDVGLKFPVVCQRPRRLRSQYTRGTRVRVLLKSAELSQTFLGYEKEMTLLEADGVLLGMYSKEQKEAADAPPPFAS